MQRFIVLGTLFALAAFASASGCRVESEQLKRLAKIKLERLLEPSRFESLYWPREPTDAAVLGKILAVNVTKASTKFEFLNPKQSGNDIEAKRRLIRDLFISCSADRAQTTYKLIVNLEIENPFKSIDISFGQLAGVAKVGSKLGQQQHEQGEHKEQLRHRQAFDGSLSLKLGADSSFLVQLNQDILFNSRASDGCLDVNYVQLAPNVMYELDCHHCTAVESKYLDNIFVKRMSQLDAELDTILSEKILFGLKALLSEQKLELDQEMWS